MTTTTFRHHPSDDDDDDGGVAMRIYQHSTLVKIFYTIYVGIVHIFEAEISSESVTYFEPSGPIFAPTEF